MLADPVHEAVPVERIPRGEQRPDLRRDLPPLALYIIEGRACAVEKGVALRLMIVLVNMLFSSTVMNRSWRYSIPPPEPPPDAASSDFVAYVAAMLLPAASAVALPTTVDPSCTRQRRLHVGPLGIRRGDVVARPVVRRTARARRICRIGGVRRRIGGSRVRCLPRRQVRIGYPPHRSFPLPRPPLWSHRSRRYRCPRHPAQPFTALAALPHFRHTLHWRPNRADAACAALEACATGVPPARISSMRPPSAASACERAEDSADSRPSVSAFV